jgi:hypothetical protein
VGDLISNCQSGRLVISHHISPSIQQQVSTVHRQLFAQLTNMLSAPRLLRLLKLPSSLRPFLAARMYATQTGIGTSNVQPARKRKAVTMLNDDGRVAWGDLSPREKAARTTQQTFNFGMIIIGAVLTVRNSSSIFQHPCWYLGREEWYILCIRRCSHPIARQVTSIGQSIVWGRILDVQNS